jgi:hypothetical protein
MSRSDVIKNLSFLAIFLSFTPIAYAFNDVYHCTGVAETMIGYAPHSGKVQFDAGKVRKPYAIKLSGVNQDATVLHAQSLVTLVKFSRAKGVIWFAETTAAGTIVVWTLFEKDGDRPVTLISTKTYHLSGAVSFTAFYTCE